MERHSRQGGRAPSGTGDRRSGLRALTTRDWRQHKQNRVLLRIGSTMDTKKPLVPKFVKGWFNLLDPLDQILWEKDLED